MEAARGTGLSLDCVTDIGPHYAITLREWRQNWEQRREEIQALGYSDRFWRKFRWANGGFLGKEWQIRGLVVLGAAAGRWAAVTASGASSGEGCGV